MNPSVVSSQRPLLCGPYRVSDTAAAPAPPLSRGKRMGREPEHRAGGKPAALRSVPWQRRHRGSWAPAFAGETKRGRGGAACRRRAPGLAVITVVVARSGERRGGIRWGTDGAANGSMMQEDG